MHLSHFLVTIIAHLHRGDHFILVLDQGRTLVAIDSVPSGPSRLHSSQHPALLKDLLQPTNTDGDKVTTGSVPDVLLLRLPWPLQAIQLATLPGPSSLYPFYNVFINFLSTSLVLFPYC